MATALSKDQVLDALRSIADAGSNRDLVTLEAVRNIAACDGNVAITIACADEGTMRARLKQAVEAAIQRKSRDLGAAVSALTVNFVSPGAAPGGGPKTVSQPRDIPMKQAASTPTMRQGETHPTAPTMPGVGKVIAVGAGKGGVGKSTISVNLAVGLARQGHAVGLLDGDIYGPSVPTLLGLDGMETQLHRTMLQPFYVHGVKSMTIGKLVDPEKPLIWRGPMAHGAFKQLVEQTEWGELDYLIIDLPPGTGDVSLTMAQMLSIAGAIIVCTPQKVAQDDAVRAARMFQTLHIDVLGVVENMSYFIGDDGKEYDLFGRGGAEQMAQRLGLPFLGAIPIHMELRENSDSGNPTANFTGNPGLAKSLEFFIKRVEDETAMASLRAARTSPTLTVS
jgi:ATP-binding protein involved in chromosome partitioning